MTILQRSISTGLLALTIVAFTSFLFAGDAIPKAAWKRGIGQPLENAGGRSGQSFADDRLIVDEHAGEREAGDENA